MKHHEVIQIVEITRTVVLGYFTAVSVQVQRRETVHLLFVAQRFARVESAVDLNDVHVIVAEELLAQLLPRWRQALAMPAPGREELDEGQTPLDAVLETLSCQT